MAMLRQLPQLLRFIPGTAQDVRAYFLTLQYWLAGSEENIANMVRFLVDRYATAPRKPPRQAEGGARRSTIPKSACITRARRGRIADTRRSAAEGVCRDRAAPSACC